MHKDPWEYILPLPKTKSERHLFNQVGAFIKKTWNNVRGEILHLQIISKTRKEEKKNGRTENHRDR